MHPLLDSTIQIRAKKYESEKRRWGLISTVVSFTYILIFYFSGFSAFIAHYFPGGNTVLNVLFYSVIFIAGSMVIGLPLGYYSGFRHEHKWGFSTQTLKHWWMDQLKSSMIAMTLGSLIVGVLLFTLDQFPTIWWLVASLAVAVLGIIFTTLFPVLILPLFNKYTPVDNEGLVSRLKEIMQNNDLKASGFFQQDMSIRTKKENAFLAGLGKTRRVVMSDTLLDNMSNEEIESVIAHEVGHDKHKHLWKNIIISTVQQILVFWLLNKVLQIFFPLFPGSTIFNLELLPLFMLGLSVISAFLSPLNLWISRIFEHQADQFSLDETKNPKAFTAAMAGLANRNLSNAYPEWWIKLLYYSHPPIGERLERGEIAN